MSTYVTLANVQARYLPNMTLDGSSRPTSTAAQAVLDDVERYVNGALRQRYSLPITNADALALLGDLSARLAAARIWRTKYYGESPSEFVGDTTYADRLEQAAEKELQRVRDGEDVLGLDTISITDVVEQMSEGMDAEGDGVFEIGQIL